MTLALMAPASADTYTATSNYTISFLGLTVARSTFTATIDGDAFSVSGDMRSAGIAKLFDSTTGTTSIKGRFVGDDTRPSSFRTQYKSGKKSQVTTIAFAGGSVTSTRNDPPTPKRATRIPLKPEHLRSVVDPLSATLVRARNLASVCSRTLSIYDGEMRMNLMMSQAGFQTIDGVETVTCNARFVPVAGYRTDNKSIQYMRDRGKIRLSFAQLGQTGVYAPVRATISTTMGPVTINSKAQ